MENRDYNKIGRLTALFSFLIGSGIFGVYFFASKDEMILFGYAFLVISFSVNLIILILILINKKEGSFRTLGLMSLNIPVALLYIWFTLFLMSTMRITFTNITNDEINEIAILGCEKMYIDNLTSNSSATVWLDISGDCHIDIEYYLAGEFKRENVVGYTTPGTGEKIDYKIGNKN